MALPIGSLIVASGHHPNIRVVYAIDESAGGDAVVAKPSKNLLDRLEKYQN